MKVLSVSSALLIVLGIVMLYSKGPPSSNQLQMEAPVDSQESLSLYFPDTDTVPKDFVVASESEIEALTRDCMTRSNFQPLVAQAKKNAMYFYNEFRKSIPLNPLSGYSSYCWKTNYTVYWESRHACSGVLGNITYETNQCTYIQYIIYVTPYMTKVYPTRKYKSNFVCIPNVFIAGFPKAGSTFFYNFVNNLISISFKDEGVRQVAKEPQFWVHFLPHLQKNIRPLEKGVLGGYLLNFVPGTEKITKFNIKNLPLLDATPNTVMDFPRFNETENNLTNYCIMPVVLPRLLPDSKYMFVMRNPISHLYSGFWFSCTRSGKSFIGKDLIKKGPDAFHHGVVSKTRSFNTCMRNTSEPGISEVCRMEDKHEYASCIRQRLHLLDKCSAKITFNISSKEIPQCGEIRLYSGIYYVHIKKWIDLVARDRLLFFTLEEMKVDAIRVASEIVQALGLDPTIVTKENIQNATQVNARGKKKQRIINYRKDPSLKMREDTASILEVFYHPFNTLLVDLLGDNRFKWF